MFSPLSKPIHAVPQGWVIRHRVVSRRDSASTPEGPGYDCWSGYGRGGAPVQAAFHPTENASVRTHTYP